ncbi:ABC transporter permease subunit [Myxococcota bacterium]|nr:ABC transporter permease subunit [Myxococcota bacterium]MBU1897610.1 ABC transporter permease subunit [Myxococcota bacterium]
MNRTLILRIVISFSIALGATFIALAASPYTPEEQGGGRGSNTAQTEIIPKTFIKRIPFTIQYIRESEVLTLGRQSVIKTILERAPISFAINLGGITIGWLLGLLWGTLAGLHLGRTSGYILMSAAIAFYIIPAPITVSIFREFVFGTQLAELADMWPAVVNLGFLLAPAIAINHGILIAEALRHPDARFARAIGLPLYLQWRHILLPKTKGYWRANFALLALSLFEGPIFIEVIYNKKGLGDILFRAALESDRALIFWTVFITSILIFVGMFLSGQFESIKKLKNRF